MRRAGAERKQGLAGGIALALISVLLAFAVPEGLLRLFRPSFSGALFGTAEDSLPGIGVMVELTRSYQETHGITQPGNFLESGDLLWSLVPGYRGEITRLPIIDGINPTWRLAINDRGLRGDPATERRDVYRVLCIGDSITFGDKLDEGDTYPAILARLLRRRAGGRPIEVVNAGVPGYSSYQGLIFWRRLAELAPSAVIVGYGFNDVWPSRISDRESLSGGGGSFGGLRALLRKTRTYHALRILLSKLAGGLGNREAPVAGTAPGRRVPIEETEKNVRTILREAHAQGIFAIVAHFAFGQVDIQGALGRAAREEGAPFLDGDALLRVRRAKQQEALAASLDLRGRCPHPNRARSGIVPRVRMGPGREAEGPIVARVRGLAPRGTRNIPLNDRGTGCDERADDGVHTGLIMAAPGRVLHVVFAERLRDGTLREEFHGFPLTWREMTTGTSPEGGPAVAPVETYNRFSLMSERIHPDANGSRLIAEELADLLEKPLREGVQLESAYHIEGRGHA